MTERHQTNWAAVFIFIINCLIVHLLSKKSSKYSHLRSRFDIFT